MTNRKEEDQGVILALLERFKNYRLPRALEMKKRVDDGEKLDDTDIAYLEQVFADSQKIQPLLDRHPEYTDLVGRAANLYNEITAKALDNEERER